jgi:hypothetical protein
VNTVCVHGNNHRSGNMPYQLTCSSGPTCASTLPLMVSVSQRGPADAAAWRRRFETCRRGKAGLQVIPHWARSKACEPQEMSCYMGKKHQDTKQTMYGRCPVRRGQRIPGTTTAPPGAKFAVGETYSFLPRPPPLCVGPWVAFTFLPTHDPPTTHPTGARARRRALPCSVQLAALPYCSAHMYGGPQHMRPAGQLRRQLLFEHRPQAQELLQAGLRPAGRTGRDGWPLGDLGGSGRPERADRRYDGHDAAGGVRG